MTHVALLGAGAYGTALALAALRAEIQVTLWSISLDEVETINQRHENVFRLPGIALDPNLYATIDPQEVAQADMVILVPPAQYMRSTCETFQGVIPPTVPLIIASKGIEDGSSLLMSEVIREIFPQNPLLALSGPSFASEVAKKLPTSVALAAEDLQLSQKIGGQLSSPTFCLTPCQDIIGVQVAGACKNIIAIACGIIEGQDLGENARAAVMVRGLDEITRLGCAMGGKVDTFLGLAGVGDMILTSLSSQSRNKSFGVTLGKGTPLKELLLHKKGLTEGIHTVSGAIALAQKYKVDMPITLAMHDFLKKEGAMEALIETLLSCPLKEKAA